MNDHFLSSLWCREHVELENLRGAHTRTQEEAKKEKVCSLPCPTHPAVMEQHFLHICNLLCSSHQLLLTNQLEMEKMKVEQEKKKCYLAQEALKEKVDLFYINDQPCVVCS